jgi:hypothetical protein
MKSHNIDENELLKLAKWVMKLQCPCGFNPVKAQKEPCACLWTPIEDWFWEYDIDLRELDMNKLDNIYFLRFVYLFSCIVFAAFS